MRFGALGMTMFGRAVSMRQRWPLRSRHGRISDKWLTCTVSASGSAAAMASA